MAQPLAVVDASIWLTIFRLVGSLASLVPCSDPEVSGEFSTFQQSQGLPASQDVVNALGYHRADTNVRAKDGATPLVVAAELGEFNVPCSALLRSPVIPAL